MSNSLRINLGKSKVEDKTAKDPPWSAEAWAEASKAYSSGWRMPEVRCPVVINADGPLSSPERLKQLANLPSVPQIITVRTTSLFPDKTIENDGEAEEVQVCGVSWEEFHDICDRTEGKEICVWFQDKVRAAWLAHSVKEGVPDAAQSAGS